MSDVILTVGFWHPFGAHARESRDAIIARKRSEIARNGWTLWSFQYRKVLAEWRAMLPESNPVFVLCSDSPGARDPGTAPRAARLFRAGVGQALQPIPSGVSVPHPANAAGLGSAFVVDEVISFPGSVTRPAVEGPGAGVVEASAAPADR